MKKDLGQVIVVAQEKGGSGKSATVALLASRFIKDGVKVLILDIDPQQTAYKWAKKSVEKKDLNISFAKIEEQEKITGAINKAKDNFDIVLVDTAGIESQDLFFVIMKADLVLLPTKACDPDMMGMQKTYNKVQEISDGLGRKIPVFAILSDVDKDTKITAGVKSWIKSKNIPLLDKAVFHRTKIKEFMTNGGFPEGNALKEANELVAALQIEGVIEFYNRKVA